MVENCGDLMCAADLICVVGKKAIRPPSCSSSILSKQSTEPQSTTVKSSPEAKGVNSSLNSKWITDQSIFELSTNVFKTLF